MKDMNNFYYTNWGKKEETRLLLATTIELRVYKKKNIINLEELEIKAKFLKSELDDLFSSKIKDINLLRRYLIKIEEFYMMDLFELLHPEKFAIAETYVKKLSKKSFNIFH